MAITVCLHSFRGGTGKSNVTANLAALLVRRGLSVAVVDTDIQSPGVHVLFGLDGTDLSHSLNEYLWGECSIEDVALDVTSAAEGNGEGRLWVLPASLKAGDIARVLHDGYDVSRLDEGFEKLVETLAVDVLLVDTHPGLDQTTLLSVALADVMLVLLRPDKQDFQGTAVTLQVARRLGIPRILLLLNKVPRELDAEKLEEEASTTYGLTIGAVIPHAEELMVLGSAGLLAVLQPNHPVVARLDRLADTLLQES